MYKVFHGAVDGYVMVTWSHFFFSKESESKLFLNF